GAEGPSFETIVATGARSALPHSVPGTVKILKNKALMIDMGLILDGYCSDMTRTFVVGKASKKYLKIHRLVRKAQLAAIKQIRAGVSAASIDKAARDIIVRGGYGKYFGHALGHGVGMAVHEAPRLGGRNRRLLKAGMIITVEPGIYLPDWGGVRLENMVVVREDSCDVLNQDTTWLDI
ncbi:MAG: M24 family metallopeptidase, partial [Desulfobulbaceae bacterium]|nr:M24 family metallopeptidase [Desulfobulbaceae bacterium]